MNTIQFLIQGNDCELGLQNLNVDLIINDRPLREIIKEYEPPMAQAEGHLDLARSQDKPKLMTTCSSIEHDRLVASAGLII